MFTGLIAGTAKIVRLDRLSKEMRLALVPDFPFPHPKTGESIAVNGACLSLEDSGKELCMYASTETLAQTNLGELRSGSRVNLERAVAMGERLGGHIVSGHVDCLAVVTDVRPSGRSRIYRLEFPEEFQGQIVRKGSVSLDGISLTVNECGRDFLEVNIIPETQKNTTINSWKNGTRVNMETDLIGKYVQHLLQPWTGENEGSGNDNPGISLNFLREHGF